MLGLALTAFVCPHRLARILVSAPLAPRGSAYPDAEAPLSYPERARKCCFPDTCGPHGAIAVLEMRFRAILVIASRGL